MEFRKIISIHPIILNELYSSLHSLYTYFEDRITIRQSHICLGLKVMNEDDLKYCVIVKHNRHVHMMFFDDTASFRQFEESEFNSDFIDITKYDSLGVISYEPKSNLDAYEKKLLKRSRVNYPYNDVPVLYKFYKQENVELTNEDVAKMNELVLLIHDLLLSIRNDFEKLCDNNHLLGLYYYNDETDDYEIKLIERDEIDHYR